MGVIGVAVFKHPSFRTYTFEEVPLDRDVFLMDEQWLEKYEASWVAAFNGDDYENVGYISYAAVRHADEFGLEISWYPNLHDRFHEVRVRLPRDQFITCVDSWQYDEKPHIFVKDGWLSNLYLRPFSAFALVDAIGVKRAIVRHELSRNKLVELRTCIDALAANTSSVCFVSFADSLLIKSNWSVGTFDSDVEYTYEPETLVKLFPEVANIYQTVLGLKIYATITQGLNEYYDESLIHVSRSEKHVCLNSIGLPFAQLLAIDNAARQALRDGVHGPSELYIDENFYHSLRFQYGFDKHALPSAPYTAPLSEVRSAYYICDAKTLLRNFDSTRINRRKKR